MKTTDQEGDPRLSFVYHEALRGLTHQEGVVENLNSGAGHLTFATAFATSLLCTRALSDGVGVWDWAALFLLFLLGALTVFMVWPYYNYAFRFDPEELLAQYVDRETSASMAEIHRALALRIKADNGQQLAHHPAHPGSATVGTDSSPARNRGMAPVHCRTVMLTATCRLGSCEMGG